MTTCESCGGLNVAQVDEDGSDAWFQDCPVERVEDCPHCKGAA